MARKMRNNIDGSDKGLCNVKLTNGDVKSTAAVKYATVQFPAAFDLLQSNTDLKLPPTNWLSRSAERYGLHYSDSTPTGFSR